MAETAIYLALRKIGIALGRERSATALEHDLEGRSALEHGLEGGSFLIRSFTIKFITVISEIINSDDILVLRQAELQGRLRRIESELRMILCFLAQIETRYDNKQVLQTWIGEARKLGCLVEQIMDEYIVYIVQSKQYRLTKRVQVILASHRFTAQLKEIEVELEHLSKMKKRWVQVDKETSLASSSSMFGPHVNNIDTKRYAKRKEKLIESLKSKDMTKDGALSVIAVYGQPGSGKTHLVKDVYASEKKYFSTSAWISIAQCPNADTDALKRMMMEELGRQVGTSTESTSLRVMTENQDSKFLFVFDDVWVPDMVHKVHRAASDNKMGSRIIIIARMPEVAFVRSESSVESQSQTPSSSLEPVRPSARVPKEFMKLTCLHPNDSFDIFCTKAFGRPSDCPIELREVTLKIIGLCNFLPQAIVSIGALLSSKQKTESVWSEMAQQIEDIQKSKSSLNNVQKVLYLSYKNLPMHLKNCLLYCSTFPAGFLLLPESLVRLWAAEGFIENQGSLQVEEIGERYIKELIHWGFLQVVDVDEQGRVASCRMPIVVHELAVSISQKEEFGAICHGGKLAEMDTNVRCLFISENPEDIGALVDFPYLRTLMASRNAAANLKSLPASLTAKLKYLTVLKLQESPLEELPRGIGYQLFNLRYLGLRKSQIRCLPSSMAHLYNLQTLDLRGSRINELPSWIGKLIRLRHLFADTLDGQGPDIYRAVKAPKTVNYLKELRTLETVQASDTFEKHVEKLTQLTTLSVVIGEGRSSKTLFSSLSKLSCLSSLHVSASRVDEESLDFETLNPTSLEKLVIRGGLAEQTFQYPIFKSKQIKVLELSLCKLRDDSLALLSTNLCNLESLRLHNISGISKLVFRAINSFANLRTLLLHEIDGVDELEIPNGSLGSLQVLHVVKISQLNSIHDQERIISVRDLYFPQLWLSREKRNAS